MDKSSKIFVAGHTGLLGTAILRKLAEKGYNNIVTRIHKELELKDSRFVNEFFSSEKTPIFICGAKASFLAFDKQIFDLIACLKF